jgi:hypothetical protein
MRARILMVLVAVLPVLMVSSAALYCWDILRAP